MDSYFTHTIASFKHFYKPAKKITHFKDFHVFCGLKEVRASLLEADLLCNMISYRNYSEHN